MNEDRVLALHAGTSIVQTVIMNYTDCTTDVDSMNVFAFSENT